MFKTVREYITIERVILFGVILSLLIHLYFHIDLVLNKTQNPSLLNTVNSFIILITLSIISLFLYSFFFQLLTKDAHLVEKWALKNLTKVCYFIIILLGIAFIQKYLKIEQFLTSIGATVVFWYSYKRYERDKEIQMIERYSDKYNLAIKQLVNNGDTKEKDYTELLGLWYEEYFLYDKGYISGELWNEWKFWIKEDVGYFLGEAYRNFNENIKQHHLNDFPEDDWFLYCLDQSKFLDNFFMTYLVLQGNNKRLIKDEFGKFLLSVIKDEFDENKTKDYLYANKNWIICMNSLFRSLNNN